MRKHAAALGLTASMVGTLCHGCADDETGQPPFGLDSGAFDVSAPFADSGRIDTGGPVDTGAPVEDSRAPDDSGVSTDGAGSDTGATDAGADADASRQDASPLQCPAGMGDCDLEPGNGCETQLTNNAAHCGVCGRDCAAAGATCQVDKCSAIPLYTNQPIGSDNGNARTFAFGNGAIYHARYGGYSVRRMPLDGSGATIVWSTTGKSAGIESLALTSTHVMWAERGSPDVMLSKPFTALPDDLPAIAFQPEYQPSYVRVVGDKIYWASGDYQSGDPAGYIYSRDVADDADAAANVGTRIVTVNQGNHGAISALEVSSDALYWVSNSPASGFVANDLRTAPLAGGTPTAVPGGAITGFPFEERTHLQAIGNRLYFNRNVSNSALNGIYRYTPGDTAPTQLVMAEDVTSFLVTENDIYFETNANGNVWRAPITGGQAKSIATYAGGGRGGIVGADAKYVYVVSASCCVATIYKVVR